MACRRKLEEDLQAVIKQKGVAVANEDFSEAKKSGWDGPTQRVL